MVARVNKVVQVVNNTKVAYAGGDFGGDNSNNYAQEAFKVVTRRRPVNNSSLSLPGLNSGIDEID